MDYRHELKHEINMSDMVAIRHRLRAIAKPDENAIDGKYFIRSLYFDNPEDKALREKIEGVNRREKFRIRYYNLDTSVINLEKKSKLNGLGSKESALLTKEQAQMIVDGQYDFLRESGVELLQEFYSKIKAQGLKPRTIVDYIREPFVYAPGNVRVTLDYDIRTGLHCTDFLNPECITIPAKDAPIILEVKWDEFLPDIIRDAVQLGNRRAAAYSKYAACRVYG